MNLIDVFLRTIEALIDDRSDAMIDDALAAAHRLSPKTREEVAELLRARRDLHVPTDERTDR